MEILKSATKITLLLFTFTICIAVNYIIFTNSTNETVITTFLTVFNMTVWAVFGHYFKLSKTTSETEWK